MANIFNYTDDNTVVVIADSINTTLYKFVRYMMF